MVLALGAVQSLETDEAIEAAAAGMYGKNWNGPDDKRPGEEMKAVWRDYARRAVAPLAAAIRSRK